MITHLGYLAPTRFLVCDVCTCSATWKPKGPSRTKDTTTIEEIANYYAVFLLRRPYLLSLEPFFRDEKCLQIPRKRCPHKAHRNSKSQCDSKISTAGPLGQWFIKKKTTAEKKGTHTHTRIYTSIKCLRDRRTIFW